MSILGNRVVRLEDPRFLRGEGLYVENLELDGALSVTFVRSPLAHARVNAVDASAAEQLPNVQVFTGANVDAHPFAAPPPWHITPGMERPLVVRDVVRFAGDIVAVVVSEDRASGLDAAELVMVDYDPLPAVLSVEEAVKDEVLLFPEVGSNVANRGGSDDFDDGLFDGCDLVVSSVLTSQRLAAAPLEPRSAAALVGEDGRLTLWVTSQTPHTGKMVVAGLLGLDPGQVRVVSPDVGGGFGAKMIEPEGVLVAWVARTLGRPVRWTETRSESMLGSRTARPATLVHARRDTGREAAGLPARGARRRRRLPRPRRLPPQHDRADVERRVCDPEGRDEHRVGRDQYDAHHLDPRRRPTGGDAGDRAGDRSLRGRGRARPGRGPPHELHRQRCVPLCDANRRDVRLGRLRGCARPLAPLGRLRGAPGGATASTRRGLGGRARDRAQCLRRDLEPRR